jgi:prepilin-type N-terminal cleavage/methylation domain-containing protein
MVAPLARNVTVDHDRRLGYTLVELMIVVVLVGMLAVVATPRGYFTTYQLDASARSVRIALQNAQRLAVTRQLNVIVSIDVDNNRIRILEEANNNGSINSGERVTWVTLESGAHFSTPPAGIWGSVSGPVVGAGLGTVSGLPSVIFRRDGAASSDVEVYLNSARAGPNDFRGITVVQATGRTDWYKYIGSKWLAGNQ